MEGAKRHVLIVAGPMAEGQAVRRETLPLLDLVMA